MYFKKINDMAFFDPFNKKILTEYKDKKMYHVSLEDLFNILNFRSLEKMYLVFTITQKCNLSCKYCFQNGFERKDIKENDLT